MNPLQTKRYDLGAELSYKDRAVIPLETPIRCLRDQIIVEPLDAYMSALVLVVHEIKPVRGIVRAVGPGIYPKRYDHADKHKRTKMWVSPIFQPTEVKVGDLVELGGREIGGYSFQTFYWGEKLMIICREADVCGIVEMEDAA